MKSRILHGSVWHMRTEPRYFFRYRVFYLDLALEEIEEVSRSLHLFSRNRFNLLSFRDADYLALQGDGPRPAGLLSRALENVTLVTHPRVFGYAFNPVSFFLHRDEAGAVDNVTAEVHNTWGERHLYQLAPDRAGAVFQSGTDKAFYVSPFIDPEGTYGFRLRESRDRVRIRIDETRPGEPKPFFRAGMDLRPLSLTDANLLAMLLRYPLVTFKTVAAIHWQGLKLWTRGERFRPNSSRIARKARVTT